MGLVSARRRGSGSAHGRSSGCGSSFRLPDPSCRRLSRRRRRRRRSAATHFILSSSSASSITATLLTLLLSLLLRRAPAYASSSSSDNDGNDVVIAAAPPPLDDLDPSLRLMEFDIGYGPETFYAYVTPDVSSFYRDDDDGDGDGEAGAVRTPSRHSHGGLAGKFVNMSPEAVRLYWDPSDGSPGISHAIMGPFQAVGTATFPGHRFYLTPTDDASAKLMVIDIEEGRSAYYYDPIDVLSDPAKTLENVARLTFDEYQKYERQRRNRMFAEEYRAFTGGRDYLALYPRPRPRYHMWDAEYFGQEHWVETRETHFARMPPSSELVKIRNYGRSRVLSTDDGRPGRQLSEYRDQTQGPTLNMTLKVLSCAPRVFEIRDFLSDVEIDHILHLATGMELDRSSTGAGVHDDGREESDDSSDTRTSYNTWVPREDSPIIDAIYRRAADLLQIDEALFRYRDKDEHPHVGRDTSIAESLQLVHYDVDQEYTAHHDFGFGDIDAEVQEERYATLLLYLNEGMEGGETSFPKWTNAETEDGLDVVPERGKAVLFYSQLPDGNMDDLSIHAAKPVTKGEKWLMNLWVHDPFFG